MDEPNCRCQNEHSPCTCTDAKIRHLNDKLVEIAAERDHWRWEAQRQVSLRHEIASLLGTEDIEQAIAEVKKLHGLRGTAYREGQEMMLERCVRFLEIEAKENCFCDMDLLSDDGIAIHEDECHRELLETLAVRLLGLGTDCTLNDRTPYETDPDYARRERQA